MQIKAFTALVAASLATAVYAQAPETGTPETVTGALGDAKEYDSPKGNDYEADFTGTKISGSIKFHAMGEEGVHVAVSLSGFPTEGGPFGYHVHDQPVPADGNCTGTKAHLDPFQRGQKVACDPKRPESCEVGDLAGKHGKIPAETGNGTYSTTYMDEYITLTEGVGSFIGNRSIVIHLADASRYVCVNITAMHNNGTTSDGHPPKPEDSDGAASSFAPGFWGVGVAAAALTALLF